MFNTWRSDRFSTLFAISIPPPTLHNDASRIRYDLTPYSLLYIIQMDFPDINTVNHPVSLNTFVPEWLAVTAQHNALGCVLL